MGVSYCGRMYGCVFTQKRNRNEMSNELQLFQLQMVSISQCLCCLTAYLSLSLRVDVSLPGDDVRMLSQGRSQRQERAQHQGVVNILIHSHSITAASDYFYYHLRYSSLFPMYDCFVYKMSTSKQSKMVRAQSDIYLSILFYVTKSPQIDRRQRKPENIIFSTCLCSGQTGNMTCIKQVISEYVLVLMKCQNKEKKINFQM